MPLTVTCPRCGRRATAPDSAAGGAVACPACAATILLPAPLANGTMPPPVAMPPGRPVNVPAPPGDRRGQRTLLAQMWSVLIALVCCTLFFAAVAAKVAEPGSSIPITAPLWAIAVALSGYVICRAAEALVSGPGRQGGDRR
jgi:hypothetical protein